MDTRILNYWYCIQRIASALKRLLFILLFTGLLFNPGLSAASESFRILSQNLNRLFDNIDDGNGEKVVSKRVFRQRVEAVAERITGLFRLPDIIALQEVENINVLNQISNQIHARLGIKYKSILREGNDISGIDIGYLLHPRFRIDSISQLFKNDLLEYDKTPLFSRPPLYLQACIGSSCLSLLNLHLRSMRGLGAGTQGERVQLKRLAQAEAISHWIDNFQRAWPDKSLMVLGDFNALTPSDSYFDLIGTIRGDPNNLNKSIAAKDWVEENLIDLTRKIPVKRRYSYIYYKKKQILDYMLVNTRFKPQLQNIAFSRIDYRFSDHAALIADFTW